MSQKLYRYTKVGSTLEQTLDEFVNKDAII